MRAVDRLLERVGLTQYAHLFADRQIDLDDLVNLSERDLEGLGLASAARRTLLQEIGRLAAERASSVAPAAVYPTDAERRQLTLMFCDLVDSVRLSNRLDPEDLRDVITAYQRACTEAIQRYGGYVARYVGDGILAFFGYPTAHEDDAERAVRAGRDLIEAVTKLSADMRSLPGLALEVRIGIATGLVVVGDVAGGGVIERDAVAGEAANLASRLQGLARPNGIVVSALTRTIAAEAFEYRDLGHQAIKGFAAPVAAYEIVAERDVSRLEARSAAQTEFVDRETEIETMLQCWERAAAGNGQILVVSGEAGIGKSRFIAEACARIPRLESASENTLTFQCAPYHANSALYPIVRQLTRLAGISRSDTDQDKTRKLDRLIRRPLHDHDRTMSLIAELLGIKDTARYAQVSGSSQEKRELMIEALIDWCTSHLSERTLIIVFEDAQWIDPTSRMFLRRLADWAERRRVLLVITERNASGSGTATMFSEIRSLPTGLPKPSRVTFCEIGELSQSHVRQLIAAAAQGSVMSAAETGAILDKSAGLPLYVEELTRSFLHTRGSFEAQGTSRARSLAVPHTINDALMARLDQLGHAKEIAQYASAIGQEFPLKLLAKITTNSPDQVIPHLNALVESGIVVPSDAASDVYRFKHALIRDIAYHSLLNRVRRDLHLKIATELADPAEASAADLVAQHYSLGGAYSQAIEHWRRGATDAIARSAHEEALGMLVSAFDDFRNLGDAGSPLLELDLVLAQATALRSIRGYSAAEVRERLVRARDLARITDSGEKRFNIEWGLFQHNIVRAQIAEAREIAIGLYDLAERHPGRPLIDAHVANGMIAFVSGEFARARDLFEKGLDLGEPLADEPHFLTHGQNPGLFCLSYLAHTLCFLGDLDRAKAAIKRSLAIAEARARDPAHIYSLVNALTFAVRVHQFCGDIVAERRLAERVMDIARRNHYTYYEALSRCHLGWVIGAEGRLSEGIDQMIDGMAALDRTGTLLASPGFYALLSELCLRANRLAEANEALTRAASPVRPLTWDAEIERLRGDLLALQSQPDLEAAEAAYRASVAIATGQNARWLVLKTGLSLSRLLRRTDRAHEARKILEQSLMHLPDGLKLPEVQSARATIRELAAED
ncbi:MAG TPA: AAA family ATPase [Xanthobacteraceae bacterium]|nr:AAA family ATPase [Xanthobacteraceae bacterium]